MLLAPRVNETSVDESSDEEVSEILQRPLSTLSVSNVNLRTSANRNDTTLFRGFTSTSTPRKSTFLEKSDKLVVKVEKLSMNQISQHNANGRPRRAVTPTNLKEPNLRDKMRNKEYKEPPKRKTSRRRRATSESSE